MIRDFRSFDGSHEIVCDLCIAGAGAAGIALARAFVGRDERVVVLESGGLEFEEDVQALYAGPNLGLPYFGLDQCRLRFLGGSTNHWGGQCSILDAPDFDVRPWVPHSGWPIARSDLEPHYPAAHDILDLGPVLYDPARLQADAPATLPFALALLEPRVFRFSAGGASQLGVKYRAELSAAQNVEVWLHANVVDLPVAGPDQPLLGFEVANLAGRRTRVRARAYVLALGGIENARLLLNADRVAPGGIGNRHDLVGRFFMEHPGLELGSAVLSDEAWPQAYGQFMHASGTEVRHAVALSPQIQAQQGLLNIATFFGQVSRVRPQSAGYKSLHDLREALAQGSLPEGLAGHLWNLLSDLDGVVLGTLEKLDSSTYITATAEQAPNPDSRVLLDRERDALGLRRSALDWRLTELDWRTAKVMAQTIGRELGRLGVARLQLAEWLQGSEVAWGPDLIGQNHHMGTTRMAQNPRDGVVGPNGAVFECANLFIAGSSVFPTSGFANPTLTLVALTLRLADHLKDWLPGEPRLVESTLNGAARGRTE